MKTNNKNNFQNRIKFKKWYNNNNDKLNDCLLYFYRKNFYDFIKQSELKYFYFLELICKNQI